MSWLFEFLCRFHGFVPVSKLPHKPRYHHTLLRNVKHLQRQTLELVRFFERLPHQDASLKNTVTLRSTKKGCAL